MEICLNENYINKRSTTIENLCYSRNTVIKASRVEPSGKANYVRPFKSKWELSYYC